MKMFTKEEFGKMELSKLETEKNKIFKKILEGKEARRNRNMLYDVLGVIDEKVKFCVFPLEIQLA